MEGQNYTLWRALHLRVVQGETLSPVEQKCYEEGERQQDAEEYLVGRGEPLRALKAKMREMEREGQRLLERKALLDAEIAALEAHLSPRTRELLEVGS